MDRLKIQTKDEIVLAQGKRSIFGSSLNTCAFWVDGVIIDTGPKRLAQQFREFFEERIIEKVALTHSHEDHCGNASLLTEKGMPVYIHSSSLEFVGQPARIPLYRGLFWGERPPFSAISLTDSLETSSGKTIQVIETPGHASDHVAFLFPERGALFTGDLFVSSSTKMGMPAEDYPEWMETLAKLLEYDFDTIYCGHAGIVPQGKKLLGRKLQQLQELQGEVLELTQKGLTVKEINKKLFPRTPPVKILSGGEWDSIHIVRSLVENR